VKFTGKTDLTAELSKLNPGQDTINIIKAGECAKLEKSQTEWIVTNCLGNVTVYFIFTNATQRGYTVRFCGGWGDGREVIQKASYVLKALGIAVDCDLDSVILLGSERGRSVYRVCDKKIYLMEGCIV